MEVLVLATALLLGFIKGVHGTSSPLCVCAMPPVASRIQCLTDASDESTCMAAGCCWDPAPAGTSYPSCFSLEEDCSYQPNIGIEDPQLFGPSSFSASTSEPAYPPHNAVQPEGWRASNASGVKHWWMIDLGKPYVLTTVSWTGYYIGNNSSYSNRLTMRLGNDPSATLWPYSLLDESCSANWSDCHVVNVAEFQGSLDGNQFHRIGFFNSSLEGVPYQTETRMYAASRVRFVRVSFLSCFNHCTVGNISVAGFNVVDGCWGLLQSSFISSWFDSYAGTCSSTPPVIPSGFAWGSVAISSAAIQSSFSGFAMQNTEAALTCEAGYKDGTDQPIIPVVCTNSVHVSVYTKLHKGVPFCASMGNSTAGSSVTIITVNYWQTWKEHRVSVLPHLIELDKKIVVDFGDNTTSSLTFGKCDTSPHLIRHTYRVHGVYTIDANVSNHMGVHNATQLVLVLNPCVPLMVNVSQTTFMLPNDTQLNVTVRPMENSTHITNSTLHVFLHSLQQWYSPGNYSRISGNCSSDGGQTVDSSLLDDCTERMQFTLNVSDAGYHALSVTCENLVSTSLSSFDIEVIAPMKNVTMTPEAATCQVNTLYTIQMHTDEGSLITYLVDWGDNKTGSLQTYSHIAAYYVPFDVSLMRTYPEAGSFLITVVAQNPMGNITFTYAVDIQNGVDVLDFDAIESLDETDTTAEFTLMGPSDPNAWPEYINITWYFEDGTNRTDVAPSNLTQKLSQTFEFPMDWFGTLSLSAKLENLVSEKEVALSVSRYGRIHGIELIPVPDVPIHEYPNPGLYWDLSLVNSTENSTLFTCFFMLGSSWTESRYYSTAAPGVIDSFIPPNGSYAFGTSDIYVSCSNGLSSVSINSNYQYEAPILSADLSMTPTGNPGAYIFSVIFFGGSNILYRVTYGDGNRKKSREFVGYSISRKSRWIYTYSGDISGSFFPELFISNPLGNITSTLNESVDYFLPIPSLDLSVTSPIVCPGESVIANLSLSTGSAIPARVTVEWTYNGMTIPIENVFVGSTFLTHEIPCEELTAGEFSISANATNPANSIEVEDTATILEAVQNPTATVQNEYWATGAIHEINMEVTGGDPVTFSIDYGNGESEDSPELKSGERTFSIGYFFTMKGTYTINVMAYNSLSSVFSDTIVINVIDPIPDSTQLLYNSSIDYPPGITIFTVSFDKSVEAIPEGVSCTWNSSASEAIPSTDLVSHLIHYEYVLEDRSTETLLMTVNCSNIVSWKVFYATLNVSNHVTEFGALIIPEPMIFKPDEIIEFTLELDFYDGTSCISWFFGNNERNVIYGPENCCKGLDADMERGLCFIEFTDRIVHRQAFTQPGKYQLNVTAENEFASSNVEGEFGLLLFECDSPIVSLTSKGVLPNGSVIAKPNDLIHIYSDVQLTCGTLYTIEMYWRMEIFENGAFVPYTKLPDDVLLDQLELVISGARLDAGRYNIIANVSIHELPMPLYDGESMELIVNSAPLYAFITGGDQSTVEHETMIVFDAGMWSYDPDCGESTDPDLPTAITSFWSDCPTLTFEWKCKQPVGDGFEPVTDCWGSNMTDAQLVVNGSVFEMGVQYMVEVKVQSKGREAEFQQVFKPVENNIILDIKCGENCEGLVLPTKRVLLRGRCVECDDSIEYVMHWTLYWIDPKNETEERLDIDIRTWNDRNDYSLEIPRDTLRWGRNFVAKLETLTKVKGKDSSGESYIKFTTIVQPELANCTLDRYQGLVLSDFFQMNCPVQEAETVQQVVHFSRQSAVHGLVSGTVVYFTGKDSPTFRLPLDTEWLTVTSRMQTGMEIQEQVEVTVTDKVANGTGDSCQLEKFVETYREAIMTTKRQEIQKGLSLFHVILSLLREENYKSICLPTVTVSKLLVCDDESFDTFTAEKQRQTIIRSCMLKALRYVHMNSDLELRMLAEFLRDIGEDKEMYLGDVPELSVDLLSDVVESFKQLLPRISIADQALISADISATTGVTMAVISGGDLNMDEQQRKRLLSKLQAVLGDVAKFFTMSSKPGDPGVMVESPSISMESGRVRLEQLDNLEVASQFGEVQMPEISSIDIDYSGGGDKECIDYTYTATKDNIYAMDPSAASVNTPVQALSLRYCDGRPVKVVGLRKPVQVSTKRMREVKGQPVFFNGTSGVASHGTKLRSNNSVLSVNIAPNPDVRELSFSVGNTTLRAVWMNATEARKRRRRRSTDDVDANVLEDGQPWICVLPHDVTAQNPDPVIKINITDPDPSKLEGAAYEFEVEDLDCTTYSEYEDKWTKAPCEVAESSAEKTKFKSSVFGSLGTGVFVGPNTINFDTVFDDLDQKLKDNVHVVATVIGIILLYFLALPFVRRLDKKDSLKWSTLPLKDNHPLDEYQYRIDVMTATHKGAGTGSNVSFILVGNKGDTGIRALNDGQRKVLQKGSFDSFLLLCPDELGVLNMLRIYHDNSGQMDEASWRPEKFMVTDMQHNKQYVFLCDRWLAVEYDDGKVDRTLRPARVAELTDPTYLLSMQTRQGFFDDFLWLSVARQRLPNPFTRVQRLTCCLALLYITMISNCMWFGRGEGEESVSGVQIGPLSFTIQQVYISVVSSLTIVPVTVLITFLFRKSKREERSCCCTSRARQTKKKSPATWVDTTTDLQRVRKVSTQSSLPTSPRILSPNDLELDTQLEDLEDVGPLRPGVNDPLSTQQSLETQDMLSLRNARTELKKVEEPESTESKKQTKSKTFELPSQCLYLAWILSFLAVAASAFFTILYSFEWGGTKSKEWLQSMFLSFFTSEGLINPFKIVLVSVILTFIFKSPVDPLNKEVDEQEVDEKEKIEKETPEDRKRKAERLKQMKALAIVRQILHHFIFVFLLLFMCYAEQDSNHFTWNRHIKQTYTGKIFYMMKKNLDTYDWIEKQVVPELYNMPDGSYYDGRQKRDIGFVKRRESQVLRMGDPNIYQYRVNPVSCKPAFAIDDHSCNFDFSEKVVSMDNYGPGWTNWTNSTDAPPFMFVKDNRLRAAGYDYYSHGHYAANLGSSKYSALKMLGDLRDQQWIDRYSRATELEFFLYNGNVNLFAAVSIFVEYPQMGGVVTWINIQTLRLYRYVGAMGLLTLLIEFITMGYFIFLSVKMSRAVKKEGRKFFRDPWHLVEVFKLSLAIGAIVTKIISLVKVKHAIEALKNEGSTSGFESVAVLDMVYMAMASTCLIIQQLQFLQILRFNQTMALLPATLNHVAKRIADYSLIFLVCFGGYISMLLIIYQPLSHYFRDFLHCIYSMFLVTIMVMEYQDFQLDDAIFKVIFVTFSVLMSYMMVLFLVVIILEAFSLARQELRQKKNEIELLQVLWQQIRSVVPCGRGPVRRTDVTDKNEPSSPPNIDWSTIRKQYMGGSGKRKTKPKVAFFLEEAFIQLAAAPPHKKKKSESPVIDTDLKPERKASIFHIEDVD